MSAPATHAPTARYRCSVCDLTSEHPADDDTPICNGTDACGLLFASERIETNPAPHKARVRFEASNRPAGGYAEGDEREYDVIVRGRLVGIVGPAWIVGATEGAGSYGWCANIDRADDGALVGEGRTRYAAVAAAYGSSKAAR